MIFKQGLLRFYRFLCSGRAGGLFFFLAPLLLYVATSPFRDLYGIEVRNALFAKEMLEKGISFIPNLMGRSYPDYPPFYFLLEYIFSLPTGRVSSFTAVLPSALSAAGTVWLLWRWTSRISIHIAVPACLILAASPGFFLKASHATVDMLLAAETFACFYCLNLAWGPDRTGRSPGSQVPFLLLSALFMFAAFFTKGPVGLIIPAAAWFFYLLMEKRWKELPGFVLYSSVAAIFMVIIYIVLVYRQGGWPLVSRVIESQITNRMGTEPNRPWYYYSLYVFTSFLPWWLLAGALPAIIRHGLFEHLSREPILQKCVKVSPYPCFTLLGQCAAGLFVIIAIFSLASSRHGRYLLPAFPFMAVFIAAGINTLVSRVRDMREDSISERTAPFHTAAIIVIITAAVVAAGLFINAMFIEPGISRQESGRGFMEETERIIPSDMPMVIYRINPDGDGLKLALYSRRSPESLVFVRSDAALGKLPFADFVLITYEKRRSGAEKILSQSSMKTVARGLVHRKKVVAIMCSPQ